MTDKAQPPLNPTSQTPQEQSAVASSGKTVNTKRLYENYPWWVIVLANLLTISIYGLGAVLMHKLGTIPLILFGLLLFYLEISLLAKACVHCYYFGKRCFSGHGKLCSLFFKAKDPSQFAKREVTWLTVLPDILVLLIPLSAGIFLMIRRFDWATLGITAGLMVLATVGNGVIRGSLACCHCQQGRLGCPAQKAFEK